MDLIDDSTIIDRKRYDTTTATLIADDVYWNGHNHERKGRNTWLFRTERGAYFVRTQSMWQGEVDSIEPVSLEEAEVYWTDLRVKHVEFEDAFPELVVEDA